MVAYRSALESKVFSIFYKEPIDVIEDDESAIYENSIWSLYSPREDGTIKIGSANYILAINLIIIELSNQNNKNAVQEAKELFKIVLQNLERKQLIKKSPEENRKGFKVITNDREKS